VNSHQSTEGTWRNISEDFDFQISASHQVGGLNADVGERFFHSLFEEIVTVHEWLID
jgi:hypothetical protein